MSEPSLPSTAAHYQAFDFVDLEQQAQHCLEQAQATAREIVQNAREEAARSHAKAVRDAETRMEILVQERLTQLVGGLFDSLEKAAGELDRLKADWVDQAERHVVRLALRMAGCVIRREVAADPQVSLSLIREALELLAGSRELVLSLHPEDYAALRGPLEQMLAQQPQTQMKIQTDANLARGGCLLETSLGRVDQRIETQLLRIEKEILGG